MAGFEVSKDLTDLAAAVLEAAIERKFKLATAESCTGGLVAALLTEIPGSSAVVERGFVTYSNEAKTEMLGVPVAAIAEHGAVSEAVASAMAEGARIHSHADLAVAITGIAGPGGSEFKPEGRVCFAVSGRAAETVEFGALGRSRVRAEAAHHALGMLLRGIRGGER